jgi:ribosomal protein S18 acetylase RimI-like enzyme
MRGSIDPPSSAERLTIEALAEKIRHEHLILAEDSGALVACAFAGPRGDHLYLSKIAVAQAQQGRGIGRALLNAAIGIAAANAIPELRLETRIELTANHRIFEAWGFRRVAETAHPGYDRPTSLTFSRML